ncbi:MAG: isoprenyl transferase [Clostridia bacterium]|nr:isoprenyl transferase [Clostridia bacterium]
MERKLPEHIGIIMDGNGRWAKQRGLNRWDGHKEGANVFRKICSYACDIGIKSITFYAFSTENWRRPPEEVAAIMDLFRDYLGEAEDRENENIKKGMQMHFIGRRDDMPDDIVSLMETAEENSKDANRIKVNIAINYGGRLEIVEAVRKLAQKVKNGEMNPEDITEDSISDNVYTAGQSDPDLIIRPSGELRLSNFLLWQSAYSELWFSDILWPDFTTDDLDKAIDDYNNRNRRFGGV